MITELKNKIFAGHSISKDEAMRLVDMDSEQVCNTANEIRKHFCGDKFDICSIVNAKSGNCTENCKFCAQSTHFQSDVANHSLLGNDHIVKEALNNQRNGILRYSIVTSGRNLSDKEVDELCKTYAKLKEESNISLCASNGLLSFEQFQKLKYAGVSRYHNNLETSRKNFPNICTTHTYDDKLNAIKNAQNAGLEVCSGGIMGLGETMEDRIDMALEIRNLGIKSVPINILNPIEGTPFENLPPLSLSEICRIVAIYRFILPKNALRLAGGRGLLSDKGRSVFLSGANAAISGDMLTTSGVSIKEDLKMINELGFEVSML